MEIGTGSRITVVCAMNRVVLTKYNGDQMSHEMVKKKESEVKRELEEKGLSFRNNQGEKHKNKTNKRGPLIRSIPILGLRKRGRHNKEDQFDPEKQEKGTIVHTSKSEQDQATRVPDEEVINNGKTRKGQERTKKSLSLEVLVGNANYKI
ncbi:hypothetical protein TNCV_5016111 [Trichonephila clavipes]|nr:hypothetical protein TNCV_5016111 [Trichonephila clavipes]